MQTTFLLLFGLWLLLTTSVVDVASAGDKVLQAVISMELGLIVLWVLVTGAARFGAKKSTPPADSGAPGAAHFSPPQRFGYGGDDLGGFQNHGMNRRQQRGGQRFARAADEDKPTGLGNDPLNFPAQGRQFLHKASHNILSPESCGFGGGVRRTEGGKNAPSLRRIRLRGK